MRRPELNALAVVDALITAIFAFTAFATILFCVAYIIAVVANVISHALLGGVLFFQLVYEPMTALQPIVGCTAVIFLCQYVTGVMHRRWEDSKRPSTDEA